MVGMAGLEPARLLPPDPKSSASTGFRHIPVHGWPGRTRTVNLPVKSRLLSPFELRANGLLGEDGGT